MVTRSQEERLADISMPVHTALAWSDEDVEVEDVVQALCRLREESVYETEGDRPADERDDDPRRRSLASGRRSAVEMLAGLCVCYCSAAKSCSSRSRVPADGIDAEESMLDVFDSLSSGVT